ncbi:MAG: DegT/DnrJ/EryC1/StrS family aminotransferase, partial [Acidobacteriota bacterium]|nr:DegT/DnrJ/EryC1/StrS family aminotransferase [Acidobacteriota bacterium]
RFIERAEILWEKGTNRRKFFRGEVDKYTWVDIGSSFLPSDIVAAFLYAQLENMELINNRRQEIFDFYYKALVPLTNAGKIRLPYVADECQSNCHLFYILLNSENERDNLMNYLKKLGILAIFHYLPLHLSQVGRSFGYTDGQLPVTESLSSRLIRLPFYYEITKEEQKTVVDAIKGFF